jgi:hypothetical protein
MGPGNVYEGESESCTLRQIRIDEIGSELTLPVGTVPCCCQAEGAVAKN